MNHSNHTRKIDGGKTSLSPVENSYPPMIRPLNPRKDLLAVADLIELCFAETLDQSGQNYIRQLRRIAKDTSYFWLGLPGNPIYTPREGFVWEEQGKVIGNLSIFPFRTSRGTEYLIANVAVHPDFRRRGIAHLLTKRALQYIRERGGRQAWLNVREDNHAAYSLYRGLDFSERLRRTHWQYRPSSSPQQVEPSAKGTNQNPTIQIRRRSPTDWQLHQRWLVSTYPKDYHWHLDFQLDWFAPGLFSWLNGFLNDNRYQHFSVLKDHHLIAVVTLQSNHREGKFLWMACDPQWENEAFQVSLRYLFNMQTVKDKITLDYPAHRAEQPLRDFGFIPTQTLIWMQRSLSSNDPY